MESHRPGRPSLACGRLGGATRERGCVAAGAVVPRGGWGAGAGAGGGGGGGGGQTVILDPVSVEASSKSSLVIQAERIPDAALSQLLSQRLPSAPSTFKSLRRVF